MPMHRKSRAVTILAYSFEHGLGSGSTGLTSEMPLLQTIVGDFLLENNGSPGETTESASHAVWDSSIVMSKYFERWGSRWAGKKCLDLSAGCGLVGIVLARLGAEVVLTDLLPNLPLLADNCKANGIATVCHKPIYMIDAQSDTLVIMLPTGCKACCTAVPVDASGSVMVKEHRWGERLTDLGGPFDVIVACDVMYIEAAIPDLVKTLVAAASPFTEIFISHGRNRQAEHVFQTCCKGRFLVSQVKSNQLDEVYQTGDVDVLHLQRTSEAV